MTDEAPTAAAPKPFTPAKDVSKPVSGTDVVSICCKMPNGIVIRAFEKVEKTEATPTGIRTYSQMEGIPGSEFICNGPSSINHIPANTFDMMSKGFPGGFAITHGCPRSVWENWLKWNQGTPLVEEGLIFALGDPADAAIEAKSRESIRSGLEPLDPDHPEKTVGPSRGVSAIQPGVPS